MDNLLAQSVRAIKCQAAADIAFDLIRGGQQHPDFLLETLARLEKDCHPAFLAQLSKRIEQGGRE